MNCFILARTTRKSASMYADAHVGKIAVELVQMVSTAAHVMELAEYVPCKLYKPVYINHPWPTWVRESQLNWFWALSMAWDLCREYKHRWGKTHATTDVIKGIWAHRQLLQGEILLHDLTQPPQVVSQDLKCANPIEAYRRFYVVHKRRLFKWTNREMPWWIKWYDQSGDISLIDT